MNLTFFRRFPAETYLIGIPSLILFVITGYASVSHTTNTGSFVHNILLSLVGQKFLAYGLIFVYFYIYSKLVYILFQKWQHKIPENEALIEIWNILRSTVFWITLIAIGTFAFGEALALVFRTAQPEHIARASHTLFSLDMSLFHTYPGNALNTFFATYPYIGKSALWIYGAMSYVMGGTILILLVTNTHNFRRFLIAFFVTGYVGLIFWSLIPATSPRGYIDLNVTRTNTSELSLYKATPAEFTVPYIDKTDKLWIDPNATQFNVSTFPSMHATWALLVLVSLVMLSPYIAIVMGPWCIALMLGAVGIYQHYGVDILSGIVLASVVLYMAERVLNKETSYFKDPYKLMYIWDMVRTDIRTLMRK